MPNPNNMQAQKQVYSSNDGQQKTYCINDIHMRSGTTLHTPKGPVIVGPENRLISNIL